MRIQSATFLSISGLQDMTVRFGGGAPTEAGDVTLVTGPPASGKTRLLEALVAAKEVLAPYGQPVAGWKWIRPGDRNAKIELTLSLDDTERNLGGAEAVTHAEALFAPKSCGREADEGLLAVLERYEHEPACGKVDYLPAARTLPPLGVGQGTSAFEQRIWRLSREARKFAFVPRFLAELAHRPDVGARFGEALGAMCPTLAYAGPTGSDSLSCFKSRGEGPLTVGELSTSEQDAVVTAATLLMVGHQRSIVFVDRPEAAVHEAGMAAWLGAVRSLIGDSQLIVASNSPALRAAVGPSNVVELGAVRA